MEVGSKLLLPVDHRRQDAPIDRSAGECARRRVQPSRDKFGPLVWKGKSVRGVVVNQDPPIGSGFEIDGFQDFVIHSNLEIGLTNQGAQLLEK